MLGHSFARYFPALWQVNSKIFTRLMREKKIDEEQRRLSECRGDYQSPAK